MHEAGRVEQDVDLADALGHRGDGGGVAHVEPRHLGDAFLGEQREPFSSMSVANHRGAFARKGEGAGAADAHRGRGDECAFALEAV